MKPTGNALRAALVAFAITGPGALAAAAQTDDLPYDDNGLHEKGAFHVVHDNGTAVYAFSAFTQQFRSIVSSGATHWGTGDFCSLFQIGSNLFAYSARLDAVSVNTTTPAATIHSGDVGDDVAVILASGGVFGTALHGYSAQTGTWSVLSLGSGVAVGSVGLDCGRFVIGAIWQDGGLYGAAGFSARTGTWTVLPDLVDASAIDARGNVVAATVRDNLGQRIWAYSGVHGVGSLSPELFSASSLQVNDNVAYVRAFDGVSMWFPTVFSAYDATWVDSPRKRGVGENPAVVVRDNLVLQYDGPVQAYTSFELIGTRPHLAWTHLTGGTYTFEGHVEDAAILRDQNGDLLAFSGLADGGLHARSAPASLQGLAGDHVIGLRTLDSMVHMFSPAHAAWAAPIGPVDVLATGDSVALVRETGTSRHHGYSTRHNRWVPGPTTDSSNHVAEGSLAGFQDDREGLVTAFDSRRETFESVPGTATTLAARANLLLSVENAAVHAYSLQRGAWSLVETSTPISGTLMDDDVLQFVNDNGELVAHAAPGLLHHFYQYPDGSEFLALAETGDIVSSTPSRLSVRAEDQDIVRTYWSPGRLANGVALPPAFTGLLWLQLPRVFAMRTANGTNLHQTIPLPPGPPTSGQAWMQAVLETATQQPTPFVVTDAPEPAWAF